MSEIEANDSGGGVKSVVAKVTLPTLTAMVVGSMIGAGVFSLPRSLRSRDRRRRRGRRVDDRRRSAC